MIGYWAGLKMLIPLSFRNVHLNYLKRNGVLRRNGIFRRQGNVLEIGSGTGRLLYLMRWRGWNVFGIEPSTNAADFANNTLEVPTINNFVENVNLGRQFDLVMMLGVLEHTADPIGILKKIKPWLRKGGKLYISVPRLKPHLRHGILAAPHLFMFNTKTISMALDRADFMVEHMDLTEDTIYLICSLEDGGRVEG